MRFGHSLIAGVIKSFNIFGSEASSILLLLGITLYRPESTIGYLPPLLIIFHLNQLRPQIHFMQTKSVPLTKSQFAPYDLYDNLTLESFVRGLATQKAQV